MASSKLQQDLWIFMPRSEMRYSFARELTCSIIHPQGTLASRLGIPQRCKKRRYCMTPHHLSHRRRNLLQRHNGGTQEILRPSTRPSSRIPKEMLREACGNPEFLWNRKANLEEHLIKQILSDYTFKQIQNEIPESKKSFKGYVEGASSDSKRF